MNRPQTAPITASLSSHAADTQRIVGELYALTGRLSRDLDAQPARERAAARHRARGGLPAPAALESDPADVRAALEHAHALRTLLPAAVNLAEALARHLEVHDDLHRLQIDGPSPLDPPRGSWS